MAHLGHFSLCSLDDWLLVGVVVLDVEVCEEDDAGVGGEEDEDVPEAVEVGEPQPRPEPAQQPVRHPAQHRGHPQHCKSTWFIVFSAAGTKMSEEGSS